MAPRPTTVKSPRTVVIALFLKTGPRRGRLEGTEVVGLNWRRFSRRSNEDGNMKRSRWVVLAVVAAAGWAGSAFAQAPAGGAAGGAAAGAGAAGAVKPGFVERVCIKLGKCRR